MNACAHLHVRVDAFSSGTQFQSWSVRYASGEHLGGILDITEYCKEQAALIAGTSEDVVASVVKTPWEREYPLPAALRVRLGMESEDSGASGSTI